MTFVRIALIGFFLTVGNLASNAGDPKNMIQLELKDGMVFIEMFPQLAPQHVARIKELVREGYYDGKTWHRVIDGFMAQTGSAKGDGIGGSGQRISAEFSEEKHVRGIASMARTGDPNSADSQFFIMLADSPHLDGKYTVWGRVITGMEFIEKIKKGDRNNNGTVVDPDTIISMKIQADIQ